MKDRPILLVEDDDDIREGLREILEMEGYQVVAAAHGREALEHIQATDALPGLILLDLNMPVMSGRVFLERLRAEDQARAALPVVVMTAVPGASLPGVAGHMPKPLDLETLLTTVRAFF